EHGVAQKLVATRDDLDTIAMSDDPDREHPELRTLRGWRRELFGADALKLKAGQLGIAGDGASGIRLMRL
ncbi:MAG: ribonuclease D, partial [Chloroflexota bacterium]